MLFLLKKKIFEIKKYFIIFNYSFKFELEHHINCGKKCIIYNTNRHLIL